MSPMVLLLHETPDGGSHFDWMLARDGDGRLLTFRVFERIDAAACRGFRGERIGDHRRAYLEFEGALSGERGRVRRVARGRCSVVEVEGGGLMVRADWGEGEVSYVGRPAGEGDWWVFERRG